MPSDYIIHAFAAVVQTMNHTAYVDPLTMHCSIEIMSTTTSASHVPRHQRKLRCALRRKRMSQGTCDAKQPARMGSARKKFSSCIALLRGAFEHTPGHWRTCSVDFRTLLLHPRSATLGLCAR